MFFGRIETRRSNPLDNKKILLCYNFPMQSKLIDNQVGVCYKIGISPLFLRGQGARRSLTASAFLTFERET